MITVRDAIIEDSEVITYINKVSLGYDYPAEKTKQRLLAILKMPENRLFVAESDGKVVGYIHGANYDTCYMDSLKNVLALTVLPEYQGKGIGRKLLTRLEEWSREDASLGVRLVSGMNRVEAHKFYAHCGYTMRKEQKNFIKHF